MAKKKRKKTTLHGAGVGASRGKRLVGAKDVLRYLRVAHGVRLHRATMHRYARERGSRRMPIESGLVGRRQWVTAHSTALDRWVEENRDHLTRIPATPAPAATVSQGGPALPLAL